MDIQVCRTPRVLWIELTSECPLDCIFCSRKARRGQGERMPFPIYQSLLAQLQAPRRLLLNYSGESGCYPELLEAIHAGRATGAFVELVTALQPMPQEVFRELAASGLGRLTVSLHTIDDAQFPLIYGGGSLAGFCQRLEELTAQCRKTPGGPLLDLAFVAMDRNLGQLEAVAAYAERLGIPEVQVFPVLRRDEIAEPFNAELDTGTPRETFRTLVRDALTSAAAAHPGVHISVNHPAFDEQPAGLGRVPRPFAAPLPGGARIHTCEQNPWETAHVLSNGDVVTCEVRDRLPLGNLRQASLNEIWNGARYREFRRAYSTGERVECRTCPWKYAYLPGPVESDILGSRGGSAQLLHGWHQADGDAVLWSTQQAAALLAPRAGSHTIHLAGVLPQGPEGAANSLEVAAGGRTIGKIENPWAEPMTFGLDFDTGGVNGGPIEVEFRTRHMHRPSEHGPSTDRRDLGFALITLSSRRAEDAVERERNRRALRGLLFGIRAVDRISRVLPKRRLRVPCDVWRPGISVIVPERDNAGELAQCLASLETAGQRMSEEVEAIVVVNGAPPDRYRGLAARFPGVRWQFHSRAMGFSQAVLQGLRQAHFDWVYLLNSDVTLAPSTLSAVAEQRAPDVFAIGSQIFLRDATRYREETNLTSIHLESGLAWVHDRIPTSGGVTESFYVGGGASLFRRALLSRLAAATSDYAPFYWEDVEWGWRARKNGYRVLFCAASTVEHTHRATISRHYSPQQVEEIIERNRLLFHLRSLTTAGSVDGALERIASLTPGSVRYFRRTTVMARILLSRLWNHRAPLSDEAVII